KDFYETYKKYYPYMMVEARKMCDEYKRHNVSRKKKGYKNIVFFPEPEEFLMQASSKTIGLTRKAHQGGDVMSAEELARYTLMLEQDSKRRMAERKRKEEAFLMLAQDVEPKYIKKLIGLYFRTRRTNTLDVNSRYLILLEIAQFKCKESITFLSKINSCDKNNDMRLLAFNLLQQMGEHPWLARNRKGRKRLSAIQPIDIAANPTRLVEHIYKYQGSIHNRYDVFLSHSSYDTQQLLSLKQKLNAEGLVVYIDWVNDNVMMNRRNQNEDTWNVLKLRMDESDKMLFVMTDNSLRSTWTPKEIDYFKSLNKEILVYQPEDITEEPFDSLEDCMKCMELELVGTIITNNNGN
ncbi:MAG: toll/interleukin-1 receptor domain-containing protein, partial [Bacteroidaceae bacterium]|nr:toll/interleukin-1 receptor domain-containing protein [Bacteroidaceae bacterium]